jgi:hypothetical protein
VSGATIARKRGIEKWAAEIGAEGCAAFLLEAEAALALMTKGRRRSSDKIARLQSKMAACRRFLRQHMQQGQPKTEQGKGS